MTTVLFIIASLFLVPFLYTKLKSDNPEEATINGCTSLFFGMGCIGVILTQILPAVLSVFVLTLIFK
jgi:hypothetical protein